MNYKLEMEKMRECFEQNRPGEMHLHRPWWMFADEELSKLYTEKKVLLEQGKVYYACLLQANEKLFRKFPPFDYPAQIIYSNSAVTEENPLILGDTAEALFLTNTAKKRRRRSGVKLLRTLKMKKIGRLFLLQVVPVMLNLRQRSRRLWCSGSICQRG